LLPDDRAVSNDERDVMSSDPTPTASQPEAARSAAKAHAARQWRRFGDQILSITPKAIVRFLLVITGGWSIVWLLRESWPAPLPFLIGGVIAYIVLPLVNRLSRVMPRLLAALISVVLVIAFLVGTGALIVRAVALEAYNAYQEFPTRTEIDGYVDDADGYIAGLPDPIENALRAGLTDRLNNARDRIDARVTSIDNPIRSLLLGIVNGVGAVLGLLVLPVWMLLVLRDQRSAKESINRVLPDWLEGDFWGVLRLADRSVGVYLRGLVMLGLALGLATTGGLVALDQLGFDGIRYPLTLGLLVAVMELIPVIGPIIAATVLIAVPLSESPETSVAVLLLILFIRLVIRRQIASTIDRRVVDIHPAILLVVIAALSQFGLLWTLLAAPVAVIGRDLFRYTWGRFADPSWPAGVLPGETAPSPSEATAAVAPARRVPLVYQRIRAR
jgi:predicted PurR-regulated permease PerM